MTPAGRILRRSLHQDIISRTLRFLVTLFRSGLSDAVLAARSTTLDDRSLRTLWSTAALEALPMRPEVRKVVLGPLLGSKRRCACHEACTMMPAGRRLRRRVCKGIA
jgi:hypothetical protein